MDLQVPGGGRKSLPFGVFLGGCVSDSLINAINVLDLFTSTELCSTVPPANIGGPVNSEACSAAHKFNGTLND
jgi:hypothetical protein